MFSAIIPAAVAGAVMQEIAIEQACKKAGVPRPPRIEAPPLPSPEEPAIGVTGALLFILLCSAMFTR